MTGKMTDFPKIQRLFTIFFGNHPNLGDTAAALRQAIAAYAHRLSDDHSLSDAHSLSDTGQAAGTIPPDLEAYLKKVAQHAYRVTDEDIAALKRLGYSEDALFEITVSAALGAGQARLEYGLAALKGVWQPPLE